MKSQVSNLFYLNNYFFLLITLFGLGASLLEVYKYEGFIQKHLYISNWTILNLSLISGILVIYKFSQTKNKFLQSIYKAFFMFSLVLLPLLVLVSKYLSREEAIYGLNYIFSKYHLQLGNIFTVYPFLIFLIFAYMATKVEKITKVEK